MSSTLIVGGGGGGKKSRRVTREELMGIETPAATQTFQPVPHHEVIAALTTTLGLKGLGVMREDFAVSHDGARMFGVLDIGHEGADVRFSIGLRNSHDKRMRLGITAGYRVFVCENMAFSGDFQPILRKHTSGLNLVQIVEQGVQLVIPAFESVAASIARMQAQGIGDDEARLVIYQAFVDGGLDVPPTLIQRVHELYFKPIYPDFEPRTLWSLSNAFTSAFKTLTPTSQFRSTALLGDFIKRYEK